MHVCINANHLVERWHEFEASIQDHFCIIETGFGSGLNFLTTAENWLEFQQTHTPKNLKKLTYTSIEGFPLCRFDLHKVMSSWPVRFSLSEELLKVYPPLIHGIYCFRFATIKLQLMLMPLQKALTEFEPKGKAVFDCLFLDGFAPSKNPSMWCDSALRRLSYLCKPDATFSTFTAASSVRRTLIQCGFEVCRIKGYGSKREMLAGSLLYPKAGLYKSKSPWYDFSGSSAHSDSQVTIIGAGVAGCATAHALATRGIKCLILESNGHVGGTLRTFEKSVYSPVFSADFNLYSQFYWQAYFRLEHFLNHNPQCHHCPCGIYFVADNPERKRSLKSAYRLLKSSGIKIRWLSAAMTQEYTGLRFDYPGLYVAHGGWLNIGRFCEKLTMNNRISLQFNTTVKQLTRKKGLWELQTESNSYRSNKVIFCTGSALSLINRFGLCEFDRIKGQTTRLENFTKAANAKTIINNGHYLIPDQQENCAIIGASHDRTSALNLNPDIKTDLHNISALKDLSQELNPVLDRAIMHYSEMEVSHSITGIRLACRDHLPLVGAIPDMGFYQDNYPSFLKSGRLKNCPEAVYLPGLYINTAHGSRGVTASLLCAELIADLLTGQALPIGSNLYQALHPARFFIRDQLQSPSC